ncbi:hypothetical protein [Chitiniphilus eburneus]|uniref:Uncharacterized protein n=1 Tax=Chitiniphilus eburneus TaxID=2571148 RepID=A0A4U0PFW5_9NEIS|nr:hypothetical protein [Chitiniphilus eburneus]TJZ66833.1 hypothetical protein FAZ21_16755 [Chitiniphilus eburneus]
MKMRFALVCLLVLAPHIAAASNFIAVKLDRGVELQLPKDWGLFTAEHHQLIDTTVEATMELSGVGAPDRTKANLIAAYSMPRSTYAAVRVDSTKPLAGSTSAIANMSTAGIKLFQAGVHSTLQKTLRQQGLQLLAFYGVRRATISGYPALITDYRHSDPKGPVIGSIVQIFTPSQTLAINLSYRESEQAIWKSVIGKVYKSIIIHRWP